jgi:tetratricopeptide (TPR) repeat protein
MKPPDDDDTWDENLSDRQGRRNRQEVEPLEIRLSIHPARPRPDAARREKARALLAELLAVPEKDRLRRLGDQRFQDPDLFDLLLEAGHAALPFEAHQAVESLILATSLGSRLRQSGALREEEGAARALCLLGTASRLHGEPAIAEAAFSQAARLAVSAPERGLFCRALALLRWDQGRSEEAIALLQQAGARFAAAGDAEEETVCRALLGLLQVEELHTAEAIPWLLRAAEDLARGDRPWLAAQVQLGLALCRAMAGEREKARSARKQAWQFYGGVTDEMALLSLYWQEGRAALLTGDLQDAMDLLTTVRRKMIAQGSMPEATLVTIDLGVLWLMAGREEEMIALAEEVVAAFRDVPGADLTVSALGQFLAETEAGRLDPKVWNCALPTLRLAFRLQGLPFLPIPFA